MRYLISLRITLRTSRNISNANISVCLLNCRITDQKPIWMFSLQTIIKNRMNIIINSNGVYKLLEWDALHAYLSPQKSLISLLPSKQTFLWLRHAMNSSPLNIRRNKHFFPNISITPINTCMWSFLFSRRVLLLIKAMLSSSRRRYK